MGFTEVGAPHTLPPPPFLGLEGWPGADVHRFCPEAFVELERRPGGATGLLR